MFGAAVFVHRLNLLPAGLFLFMIQDPNPVDDIALENFIEWLIAWKSNDSQRDILSEEDLKTIWRIGFEKWKTNKNI